MRKEDDFSEGVRAKHTGRPAPDAVQVLLAPDVAEVFRR
jgi:hypothetical protein